MCERRLAKNLSAEEHAIVLLQHTGTPIRIGVFGATKKAQKLLDRRFFFVSRLYLCFAVLKKKFICLPIFYSAT